MSHLFSRPMQQRQASSTSSTSSFSTPDSYLLTPAHIGEGSESLPYEGQLGYDAKLQRVYSGTGPQITKDLNELDRTSYTYALRVAALYNHLHPPVATSPIQSPISSPQDVTPRLAQRKSFSFRKPSTPVYTGPTPDLPSSPILKHAPSDAKLPKEYLIELWGLLATEVGDAIWVETKRTFLSGIKKGSRNEKGGNLREVSVLLDTFLSCIPPQVPAHPHQTHFLHLLSTSLPASAHFSSSARPLTEKDKDLLRRLRREIAGYVLEQPTAVKPALPRTPTEPSRSTAPTSRSDLSEMEETVGMIFGMSREATQRDVVAISEKGSMDELYIQHLQATIAHLGALPSQTSIQRHRHSDLSRQLASLLVEHPHLAQPLSSADTAFSSITFFTPPRKMEIYSVLSDRAEENVTLQRRAHAIVDECVKIWNVPGEEERQKEVEGLIIAWTRYVGISAKEEKEWGKMLEEGVGDLCAGQDDQASLRAGMDELLTALLGLVSKSAAGMMGGGEGWSGQGKSGDGVQAPPVSLLPLLRSGDGVFLRQARTSKRLAEISDELKGSAVGEYVQAVEWLMGGMGMSSATAEQAKGYVEVAEWIEGVVEGIQRKWANGLGDVFNPAAIVLSKQLPLFFAELQMLDTSVGAGSDRVFGLYEATGRLGAIWDDLCPGVDHGFEIDSFFEPHVEAWLRETEASKVHEWVSRAVAMDNWKPEGDQNYSQSVVDLFEFIQQSMQVILEGLPLSPLKRAIYLTDMSKYANTLHALFQVDMNPPAKPNMAGELSTKLNDKIGGKAGSWLAKGQQAMKTLERKRIEGFVVPSAALVKLSNLGACSVSLDDLAEAIKPEEAVRLTRTTTRGELDTSTKYPFTITIARGQNLLGKAQGKAADAFCVVTDVPGGERLIKTRTVLGMEDPRWDQSFEIAVSSVKQIEIAIYDRSLVGKHDLIGSASVKLDPKSWTSRPTRDVQIPLKPRGMVHLRISMDGGASNQINDIRANLSQASRLLERMENDMLGEVVERMMEYLRDQLSARILSDMTKIKDKKRGKVYVGDAELEASLGGVFEYLNINFGIFSSSLAPNTRLELQLKLWNRILEHLISLLIPPLSDRPSTTPPTPADQVEIVLRWLQVLKTFFNAREGTTEHGVKIALLQAGTYKDMMMVGQYLDLPTPALKERASAAVKGVVARGRVEDTIIQAESERMAEVLLRIVRTRHDTADYLTQQVGALFKARMERHAGML